jgi:hypothetical protein
MAINWVCVELRVASEFIVNRMDGLRGLLPRNKRIRYAIYAVGGVLALLQLLFLVVFLASGDETLNTAPGQSAGGRDVADAADFWAKYFPHDNAVQWNDFAVYLLMEYARDIRNLTSSLTPALGGHFDVDNDGAVSRKEYNRYGLSPRREIRGGPRHAPLFSGATCAPATASSACVHAY